MNYVFEELFKSFSMTAIHNEAVTHNWSEKYRKLAGPVAVFMIIMIAGRDYLIYAILSPVIILCAYYSFGNIKDFIASCEKSRNDSEEWELIYEEEEAVVEEEPIAIALPTPEQAVNSLAFVYGTIFAYFQIEFPYIHFTLSKDIESGPCGIIEITHADDEIKVAVSDGSSQYQFTLVDRSISEYDKDILSAFFKKTRKASFVFEVRG